MLSMIPMVLRFVHPEQIRLVRDDAPLFGMVIIAALIILPLVGLFLIFLGYRQSILLREESIRREVQRSLERHDAILQITGEMARHFLSSSAWEKPLKDLVARLGAAVGAGRVFLYENVELPSGRTGQRTLAEWETAGVAPFIRPADLEINSYEQKHTQAWMDIFRAGGVVQGLVADFPPQMTTDLRANGVLSIATTPIFVNGQWWGCLGVDYTSEPHRFDESEIEALQIAANLIGAAMYRAQSDVMLHDMVQREVDARNIAEAQRAITAFLSSTLNFDEVVSRLLDEIPHLVPYDLASFMQVDENVVRVIGGRLATEDGVVEDQSQIGLQFDLRQTPNLNQVVEQREPHVIADVLKFSNWLDVKSTRSARSWLGVPLMVHGKVQYIFSLVKAEPGYYNDYHADLLVSLAGQASLAFENAHLFSQTLQTLGREHRLAEIARTLSSKLELREVLQNLTRLATELVNADFSAFATIQEGGQYLQFTHTYHFPKAMANISPRHGQSLAWRCIDEKRVIVVTDYAGDPDALPAALEAGVTQMIAAPVVVDDTPIGALGLFSTNPVKIFSHDDGGLAEAVALQAAVAVKNSRLFDDALRRTREAETLRRAATTIISGLELEQVLESILQTLAEVVPYDSAAIFLKQEDRMVLVAEHGLPGSTKIGASSLPVDDRLFSAVRQLGAPLILEDAVRDSRFTGWEGTTYVHGWIGVPVFSSGEFIGILTIDSRKVGAYTASDGQLTQAFANDAAIAIQNARLYQRVQEMAILDPLTGLYNRRHFFAMGEVEMERGDRYRHPLALVMIDLDHFKDVNDTYGHLAGDQALIHVAQVCRRTLRGVDMVARYGGEEFVVLMPETGQAGAELAANRLLRNIQTTPLQVGDHTISISASMGLSLSEPGFNQLEELIGRADQALYVAKRMGRGRVCVWQAAMAGEKGG